MELKYWKCDRCGEEWKDNDEPRTAPETLTMTMSDCCMGATQAVDIHFKHLCRQCVREISSLSQAVERPNRMKMELA